MEIIAKFGSALSGFWWSLDEHERRLLIIGAAYLGALTFYLGTAEQRRRETVDELADRIAERLSRG